mgnify:CR=1 FL=1
MNDSRFTSNLISKDRARAPNLAPIELLAASLTASALARPQLPPLFSLRMRVSVRMSVARTSSGVGHCLSRAFDASPNVLENNFPYSGNAWSSTRIALFLSWVACSTRKLLKRASSRSCSTSGLAILDGSGFAKRRYSAMSTLSMRRFSFCGASRLCGMRRSG